MFVPTFPSSYPFFGLEVGFSFSASGFFNVFPRPNYQEDAAVSAYLHHLGNKNEGLFKTANRAFPDIAALAQSFQVVHEGQTTSVSGTSAASPRRKGSSTPGCNRKAAQYCHRHAPLFWWWRMLKLPAGGETRKLCSGCNVAIESP